MKISGKNKNNKKLSSEAVYWNNHFWAAEAEVTPVIRESSLAIHQNCQGY